MKAMKIMYSLCFSVLYLILSGVIIALYVRQAVAAYIMGVIITAILISGMVSLVNLDDDEEGG